MPNDSHGAGNACRLCRIRLVLRELLRSAAGREPARVPQCSTTSFGPATQEDSVHLFSCSHCGQRVFFENLHCDACGSSLGFVPAERAMLAFSVDANDVWSRLGIDGPAQRPCSNYAVEGVCNWMIAANDPSALCVSCRTTHIIPALEKPENRVYWLSLEQAKRRLFYTLLGLRLPAPNRAADPINGVSFQFLEDASPQQRVLTGHDDGVITLNIAEADDALREEMRASMHEPYRSLLGHFRHESGHYYWDRLIQNTTWIDAFRALFGDERADYEGALTQHYANPLVDWHLGFISAYASSHPWEDFAECWAHYLHMVDGLETAAAWGLRLDHATPSGPPLTASPVDPGANSVEVSLIEQWLPVSQFSNAMNRSLGLHDSYPFVVRAPVVEKLNFIHRVVGAAGRGEMPMNFAPLPPVDAPPIAPPAENPPPPVEQAPTDNAGSPLPSAVVDARMASPC
jgi:hypothetical protein